MKFLRKIFPRKKEEPGVTVNGVFLALEADLSDFRSISSRIVPRIKVNYDFDIYAGDTGPHMGTQQMTLPEADCSIFVPLFDDILLGFALDIGNAYQMLSNSFLQEHPQLDTSVLKKLAIENMLREIGGEIEIKGKENSIGMITAGGNFEAALLLFDSFWDSLVEIFGEDPCIAIPANDLCFIVAADNEAGRHILVNTVRKIFNDPETTGLLSKGIYQRTSNGWKMIEVAF